MLAKACSAAHTSACEQEAESATQASDAGRVRDVVSRCSALPSERPRASFATRNLEQDLGRLLRSGNVEQHRDVLERPQAASALAGRPQRMCLLLGCHASMLLALHLRCMYSA